MRFRNSASVHKKHLASSKAARTRNRHRWSGREYQGDRENRGEGTRQNDPVTSGEGVPAQAGRSE